MLTALLENAGHVVSRQRLFDEVWDGEVDIRSNSIDVHMSRLRARLEGSAEVRVTTLRGVGLPPRDGPGAGPRMRLWHRLVGDRPIVTRLVVAVAAAMTVVLVLAAGLRLLAGVLRPGPPARPGPRRLRSRSSTGPSRTGEPPPSDTPGETFQVYDAAGTVVAGDRDLAPLLDAGRLAAARQGATRFDVGRLFPPADRPYRVPTSTVPAPRRGPGGRGRRDQPAQARRGAPRAAAPARASPT